jgi:hypothetical protein
MINTYLKGALTHCLLLVTMIAGAQTLEGERVDSLDIYYDVNRDMLIRKIEREHIPLRGGEVQMIPFRHSERYGFVKPGKPDKFIVKPQFEQVFAVYPEGAIVKDTAALYGMVNEKGKYLIPPHYQNLFKVGGIYMGVSSVSGDSTYVEPERYRRFLWVDFYSETGKLLFNEKCHDFSPFIGLDNLTWFRYGKEVHVRNKQGEIVKSMRLDDNKIFEGIADDLLVYSEKIGQTYYYAAYNMSGKRVFKIPSRGLYAERVHRLASNIFGLVSPDADYYFCDSLGKDYPFSVISPYIGMVAPDLSYFHQETFNVADRNRGTRGVVNAAGDTLIPFEYQILDYPVNGLRFGVNLQDSAVFLNDQGEIVLGVQLWLDKLLEQRGTALEEPIGFYDGLCMGMDMELQIDTVDGEIYRVGDIDSTYFYYFDIEGKRQLELPASFVFAGNFSDGLAPAVNKDAKLGFVNKQGKWVVPPIYEIALAGAYPMPYLVVPQFIGGYAYIKAFKGYVDRNGVPYFSGKRMQDHYDFSH